MASGGSLDELCSAARTASYSDCPINPMTEIRIIELLPPVSSDPRALHCNLLTAKLSDRPSYEALSYAWGEAVFPETLQLPGGSRAITANLAAALRELRLLDRSRRLWVDAVCINQSDNSEKGHQVALMAQIFGNAGQVLGWLGEGNQQTQIASSMIKELASSARKYGVKITETNWKYDYYDERQIYQGLATSLDKVRL